MKHKLHKLMAMFVVSIFAVSAFAEEVKTDYTDAIKNASVTSKDDWTIEGDGDVKFGDGHIKTSVKNLKFYQTVVLPAGQYKVAAQAAYRYGSGSVNEAEQAEYEAIKAGAETHLAKLYAETSSYKYEANVQNRWEGASDEDYFKTEGKVSVVEGKYVPNSSAAVKAWFDAGKYVNELVFNVQEEGEVIIGIAKSSTINDYTNIGAWTLTRLGDAEADPKEEVEGGEALVDCTDKVDQNGWVCENGKANNVTIDGIVMKENFQDGQTSTSNATTGTVLSQTVTGLDNGKYNVELWANARVAWQESPATDGQEELTYLVANNVEISMKVFLNPNLNNNATYVLKDVEVTDGTMYIAMTKKAAGSNWHSIQIKSLAKQVSNNEALNIAKADLKAVLDVANAVSPATDALTAAIATAQGIYDASKNQEEVIAATAALQNAIAFVNNTNAVAGATIANPVVTDFVINGTFDTNGVTTPWQTTTQAQNQTTATNQQGAFTGNFFENWHPSSYAGKIYQVIENIPNGLYELSICAFVNNLNAEVQFVYANADKKALVSGEPPVAYRVRTIVTENKIEVGLVQESAVANWMGIDNVSLKYFGLVDANYAKDMYNATKAEAEALKDKKMAPSALQALNEALAVEVDMNDDEALVAAEAALQEVIASTQASVDFYATNKLAIDAMYSLMESTNVYTAEAFLAYKSIADDYLAQYEDGTLTATVDNPSKSHGWHAEVAYDDMLLSAFGTNNFDTNLYINTWSTEGENDGTGFTVPFFEYYVGNGESLGATTKTATVTGLKAGQLYSVEVWARVRAKDGVAAADATGITLSVGDGEAVDLTEGEVVGGSQFSLAVYEAVGAADADGNLTINFNVLEGNNISWLSFKNLKYTEWSENTGIENINANVETVIYDLSGRRVQKMEKGIYIVNGKKVIK